VSGYTKINHFRSKTKKVPRTPLAPQFDPQEKFDKTSTVPPRQIPGYAYASGNTHARAHIHCLNSYFHVQAVAKVYFWGLA